MSTLLETLGVPTPTTLAETLRVAAGVFESLPDNMPRADVIVRYGSDALVTVEYVPDEKAGPSAIVSQIRSVFTQYGPFDWKSAGQHIEFYATSDLRIIMSQSVRTGTGDSVWSIRQDMIREAL